MQDSGPQSQEKLSLVLESTNKTAVFVMLAVPHAPYSNILIILSLLEILI